MTDSELLVGIQQGNDHALKELYKTHYKMVLHLVLGNNGTDEDAKEVYQEAVILFYEKAQAGLLLLNCKVSTYLYSVCRRIWLRKLAVKKQVVKLEDFEAFVTLEEEETTFDEPSFKAMSTSLSALGEPCRGILEAYYFQGNSMQQISITFGYTNPENAKNQKYKCLVRLRKLFFGLYQAPNH